MFGPLSKPSKFVLPWRLPSRVRFHGFAPLGGKLCCDAGEGNRRLRNNTRPASPAETIATNINAATINVKKLLPLVVEVLLPAGFCGGGLLLFVVVVTSLAVGCGA